MTEAKGKYRIQTVAEMTGVPASTLRTWEQRYGFPSPDRTASAYRVYSDDDIRQITRVRELCDRGLAPAEAVNEVIASIDAPVGSDANAPVLASVAGLFDLGRAIVAAIDRFDPDGLEHELRTALVVGSHAEVLAQVIEPVWREVRRRWLAGALDRHHERLAAERLAHLARDIVRAAQPDRAHGFAVIGCFEDDDDVVTALAAAYAVQSVGLRVVFLGARTPVLAIRDAAHSLQAAVVGLAVADAPPPRRARDVVDEYAAAIGDRPWFVTGTATEQESLREPIERSSGAVLGTAADIVAFAQPIARR